MHRDDEGFLARICELPDDDGPRLIFADWLDEQGDARGEFIRVQIALAKLPPHDHRRAELARTERALSGLFSDLWAEPFRGLATGPVFRRGFVDEVKVTARQFLARPRELFAAGPIRRLHILDAAGRLPSVMASPYLAQLRGLTIYGQHLRNNLAQAVADSPYLAELKSLHLGRNQIGDLGALRLLSPGNFPNLDDLDFSENELSERFGHSWAEQRGAAERLSRLELSGNALGPTGAVALASFTGLTRLGLAGNRVGGPRLASVNASSLLLPTVLDLADNALGPDGLRRLLDVPRPTGVLDLDLSRNGLGDDGVRLLAAAPALLGLRCLHLSGNGIGDEGLRSLAGSSVFRRLGFLDVSNNPIGDDGLRAVHDSDELRSLSRIAYPGIGVSFAMRIALERKFNPEIADAAASPGAAAADRP